MALADDVNALVHNLSNAELAVTLIGTPARSVEESKSLDHTESSRSNEHGDEETSSSRDDDSKHQRYSAMSEEIRPTRDREVLQKKVTKKIDVGYLNEIRSFKDRIKSSYLLTCNQQHCPVIQERLTQHQIEHHNQHRKPDDATGIRTKFRDQAINVSPTLSRMRLPKFTLPLSEEGRLVQTEITMRDFSPSRLFIPKQLKLTTDTVTKEKEIPLKKSETREVLPDKSFYKEQLHKEILNWLQSVPLFYTLNFTTKDTKDNIVNNLSEKINALAAEAYEKNYEIKAKIEIENCLSRLPMWLHGSKRDQVLFKEGLREKLWRKIQELNEKFLGVKYENEIGRENEERCKSNESYEKEVVDWSEGLELNTDKTISRSQIVDQIMKRLTPLLKIPLHTTSYKLILKGEIIDILDDLPLMMSSPRYRTVHLNRFAEELANRLLSIQIKRELSNSAVIGKETSVFHQCASQIVRLPVPKPQNRLRKAIQDKIGECLNKVAVSHRNDLKLEICSTFLDTNNLLRTGDNTSIKHEICQFLRDTGKLTGDKAETVATMIIKNVKHIIKSARNSTTTSFDSVIPKFAEAVSVYRWGSNSPVTSTPKNPSKKEIPKLNAEESAYMTRVAGLIRTWMDTLPKQYNEDPTFKETIINDLAGDLTDELKVEQLAPEALSDKEKYQKYIMYRWLYRFQFFDDATIRHEAKPYIADFLKKLREQPVPKLTAPQHGTRQAMENIKHMQGEFGWNEDYVPKGIDVLEDQISVWMNEQPSEIYANNDKAKRDKMVHDLALELQDHLRNKSPDSEIDNDINEWLQKVVKPTEKEHIGLLSQNLKEKITNVPQDKTLQERNEERQRYMAAKLAEKRKQAQPRQAEPTQGVSNLGNIEGDPDKTIKEFIAKYIEHNYDIDDPMAVGAFSQLLKRELRKLAPPTRNEVYTNFDNFKPHEKFMPQKLNNELEYIKIISDWLKNIPIEPYYNTPGNKDRIEFVNDLAKNIQEIDEQRIQDPSALEYNYLTASMVLQSMHTYGLPILPEHKDNTPLMVDQLLQSLAAKGPVAFYASHPASPVDQSLSQSLDMSDIKEQNLSEFIADYIKINGRDIADDEMKLEAWTARLLKEIKKMVHDGADPEDLCKAQVYDKFADVPIPTDESVRRFNLEIAYIKEITDWMRNIPLLPVENHPKAEEERSKMISELAKQMCQREALSHSGSDDPTADKKLEDYIITWISRLPVDQNKEVDVPILVKQLMSRIEKANNTSRSIFEATQEPSPGIPNTVSIDDSAKDKEKQRNGKRSSHDKSSFDFLKRKKTPAEVIVEAIEDWSKKLPIKGDDKEEVKYMKEGIARQLYQKVGELNVDPIIFNDDLLYRDMLGDEIDTQLENVPQNPDLQKNREKLKEGLLNTILNTNKIIKEKSTGDNYKHKLEATIDASIPNPVQNTQIFEPGFEIYKNHLANMFILENFDHANDDVKLNYERRIKYEIDKYFESAQNKNALPLSKEQMYNELYSALFKVPMPNENSIIDEVEQVKTRCEIDSWFEELPLRQTDDLGELLEYDKILSTLAKRIHEIEKADPKADKKLHKEIIKWLQKLPLEPCHEGLDAYAKDLVDTLKYTASARKYVPSDPKDKGKSKKIIETKDKIGLPDSSEIAGPSNEGQVNVGTSPAKQSQATNAKPCLQVTPMAEKKPGDIIVEVVEEWCKQIPLISTEENNKAIRDNMLTRIIIQVSELNMDPDIFNDDVVYDELLDEELENILADLPVCCDFAKSKPTRKYQLKEILKSIKPLIKEEKARHEYKEELNSTVDTILSKPPDTSVEKVAQFNKLKDDIVENFVQYHYNKNDEEGRQIYKNKVHDAVVKFCMDIRDNPADEKVDPLVRRNQLLCELGKIPVPNKALKEEVEEIKMKKEVEAFFNELSIPDGDTENKILKNLSKRLCDIEKSGHSPANDKKMKSDITRCLKKLNKHVSHQTVDEFVDKLKNSEPQRKSLPKTMSQDTDLNQSYLPYPPRIGEQRRVVAPQGTPQRPGMQYPTQQGTYSHDPNRSDTVERWISLLPATPPPPSAQSSGYGPYTKDQRNENFRPYTAQADQSLGQSSFNYEDFERGNLLSSSVAPRAYSAPEQERINYDRFVRDHHFNSTSYGQQGNKPMNVKSPQQQSLRDTSGQMPTHPSFGHIATPRQVAQSPYYTPLSPGRNAATPGDVTPDSLFQAPVFRPSPLHRPLPVPILEVGPRSGRVPSIDRPRRSAAGLQNALIPSRLPMRRAMGDRRPACFEDPDEEEICRCERCTTVNCRGVPFCIVAMDDNYGECIGIGPMLCGMRLPECFYY